LLELAKLFQSQGFGMKQVNRHLFEGQAEVLLPHIRYLCKENLRDLHDALLTQ